MTSQEDLAAAALAELSPVIAAGILAQPELAGSDWDAVAMAVEVKENSVAASAYRYGAEGEPVPVTPPEDTFVYWELRDRTQGRGGETWDVVVIKLERATGGLTMDFASGAAAAPLRITPDTIWELPERIRPRPEDFARPAPANAPAVAPGPAPSTDAKPSSDGPALGVEVHADGGIRITDLNANMGLASLRATLDWIAEANRLGAPIRLRARTGGSPAVAAVVAEVQRAAATLHEDDRDPDPWPQGRSSLETAAWNGLVEQAADLLGRGASPDGRRRHRPYRLAEQRGHVEVVAVLRDAGCRVPRRPRPPAGLPDAVVLQAQAPAWLWMLVAPFVVIAGAAVVGGAVLVAALLVLIPLLAIGAVHLAMRNTACAIDGPRIARRRGRRWQGPIDLRRLDALGFTPPGTPRMPVLWVLGQPSAGDAPDVVATSAFDAAQRTQLAGIEGLRFVPIYAARGFLSPGLERSLADHVDPARTVVGSGAARRVWPG